MTEKDLEAGEVAEYEAEHPQHQLKRVIVTCERCGRQMEPSFASYICARCLLEAGER